MLVGFRRPGTSKKLGPWREDLAWLEPCFDGTTAVAADARPATRFFLMTGWDTGCGDHPLAGRCHILVKPFFPTDVVSTVDMALACGQKPARCRLLATT
jgi:hypothetical protein